jgi:DNA modification methylase
VDKNKLFYGDNLEVMRRHIADESVDLVYLDPPFNSNRGYNVIFQRHDTVRQADEAQIQAFDDTWRWTPVTDRQFSGYVNGELPNAVADALSAFRTLLGENDAMAYLVNMAPRLVELNRVLKRTGAIYLHCDPTMSHYLKVLMDSIFGAERFRNEIVWQRTLSKGLSTRRLPNNHDVILAYAMSDESTWSIGSAVIAYDENNLDEKTASKYRLRDPDGRLYQLDNLINPNADRPNLTYEFLGVTRVWRWTKERMERAYAEGLVVQTAPGRVPRMKRYLDEQEGRAISDVWADITPLNSQAAERLGYPTQKPLKLLDRIITTASKPGDVVLDPFSGCGTSVDSAQRLGRSWIGIDVTYLAIDLIEKRLRHTYGDSIAETYEVLGIPRDRAAALALFSRSPFDFERWAVSLINAQPNQKQVGDKGIDGVARFPVDGKGGLGRVLVSVKGGKQLNPSMVRDLGGTVHTQKAEMGVLITNGAATRGMLDEMNHAGTYTHPASGDVFPRIQIITVDELLSGKRPKMPPTILPYIQAQKAKPVQNESLF